jgi:DNA-directed RNA polymerase subunit omega
MARITIEDCMEKVPNRFHLVRMASIRAKQLKKGALPLLKSEENKHVVMSLREIAAGLVKPGEAEPAPEPTQAAAPAAPAASEPAPPAPETVDPTASGDA